MRFGFSSRLFRDAGSMCRRSFVRSDDGAVAVEFAMIVMVLMLFIFGIITLGWTFFVINNMETSAREAARRMAVAEASYADMDVTCADPAASVPGAAETVACAMLPDWGDRITVNATELCPGDRSVRVRITVNGSDAALLDIFGFFDGKILETEVVMRKEAECA